MTPRYYKTNNQLLYSTSIPLVLIKIILDYLFEQLSQTDLQRALRLEPSLITRRHLFFKNVTNNIASLSPIEMYHSTRYESKADTNKCISIIPIIWFLNLTTFPISIPAKTLFKTFSPVIPTLSGEEILSLIKKLEKLEPSKFDNFVSKIEKIYWNKFHKKVDKTHFYLFNRSKSTSDEFLSELCFKRYDQTKRIQCIEKYLSNTAHVKPNQVGFTSQKSISVGKFLYNLLIANMKEIPEEKHSNAFKNGY